MDKLHKPVCLATAVALLALTGGVSAHEFWVEPRRFQLAPNERIVANLFVGENEARAGENLLPMCDKNIRFKSVRFCVSEKQRSVRETLGGLGVVQSEIGGQMHRQS